MPVYLDSDQSDQRSMGSLSWPHRKPSLQRPDSSSRPIRIGLINNMPHSAFTATERQFISLLDLASQDTPVHLSLYALPGIPRPESAADGSGSFYSCVDALWELSLDGLIVTGKEPLTKSLKDEPCWKSFTQVVEWARENTHSTVWSCLAAHAAVLHLDGIERRKSDKKHFGVFDCVRVSDQPLTHGLPSRFQVPHSRWNGVAEEELVARGYSVLSRIADSGVDTFTKDENSLFLFFQGHPEYDADTLLREYRRDVGRYIREEASNYPLPPRGYFDASIESTLTRLREEAIAFRNEELFNTVGITLEMARVKPTWRGAAVSIYRNWLEHICVRKSEKQLAGDPIEA